ncbi:hypothetical protein [Spirosoma pomorum]
MTITPQNLRFCYLVACYFATFLPGWGQSQKQDSLLNQFERQTVHYYIKPIIGMHWSSMTRQGDEGFADADAFDLRNPRYGFMVGYHTGRVTIESGVTTLHVYTGHLFVADPRFT